MTLGAAWRSARRLSYWLLPPLLLGLVAMRVDLVQVAALLARAGPALWAMGLLASLSISTLGALRWHLLVAAGWTAGPRLHQTLPDYWRSLAAGLLLPGSLGQDGYRALALTRHGAPLQAVLVRLLLEKLLALMACVAVAGLATLGLHGAGPLASLGPAIAALAAFLLLLLALVRTTSAWGPAVAKRLPAEWGRHLVRPHRPAGGGLPGWPSWQAASTALLLSVLILLTSALQAQCYFMAVGVQIDGRINLLVAPLLFVVLALPLSFGGFGVRELAHVALYGVFAVEAEAALAVSVLGLTGLALNWVLGTALWVGRRGAVDSRAQGHDHGSAGTGHSG